MGDGGRPRRALITGDLGDLNRFRIPTLWGIGHTAPYFHDNSAATLSDVVDHYSSAFGSISLSEQDEADIVAFLQLL